MGIETVDRLLREIEAESLRERRSVDRKPFARPLKIFIGRDRENADEAFSRDLSARAMGVISRREFQPNTIATIQIHAVTGQDLAVRAELRWCRPYGRGWYLSGWSFLH
jgi:hypothetical protein